MIIVERSSADMEALLAIEVDPETLKDDGTDYAGIRIDKPWGHEEQVYKGGQVSFWMLSLNPGAETSMHCHPDKKTVLIVESGDVVLYTLTRQYTLRAGDFVHIEPGAFHKSRAENGAVLIEVESPGNKNDLVRFTDIYGRGQGYERPSS